MKPRLFLLLSLLALSPLRGADVKISALPAATSAVSGDLFPFTQISTTATKAITLANLKLSLSVPTIPSQGGQAGKFLTTNGTALSWATGGGGAALSWTFTSGSIGTGLFTANNSTFPATTQIEFSAVTATGATDIASAVSNAALGSMLVFTDAGGDQASFLITGLLAGDPASVLFSVTSLDSRAANWAGTYGVTFVPGAQNAAAVGLGNVTNDAQVKVSEIGTTVLAPNGNGSALTNLTAGNIAAGGTLNGVTITGSTAELTQLTYAGSIPGRGGLIAFPNSTSIRLMTFLCWNSDIYLEQSVNRLDFVANGAGNSWGFDNLGNIRLDGHLQLGSGADFSQLQATATNVLALRNSTAEQTLIVGPSSTGINSNSGELEAFDNAGNHTTISPHATDAPAALYETGPGADHCERKINIFLAAVHFWNVDRERRLHLLDLVSRGLGAAGTAEESLAAWTEAQQRRTNGTLLCEADETFTQYETRTGKSLVPAGQDHDWWLAHTPAERWAKVEADRVTRSVAAHDAWAARRASALAAQQAFTEAEPAVYVAQPAPAFISP